MSSRLPHLYKKYVFVLWGESFDEAAAALFVTEMRKAGLRVKMLCLDGVQAAGMYGLQIGSDLGLTQALPLAPEALCVILPCGPGSLRRVSNDPRLADFFRRVRATDAPFVTREECSEPFHALLQEPTSAALEIYPATEKLVEYARQLAQRLQSVSAA